MVQPSVILSSAAHNYCSMAKALSRAVDPVKSFDYEIFGKVQGVFFRKRTKEQADNLGIVGWVRNTDRGTVTGVAQGKSANIDVLQNWLRTKGSKSSRIDRAEFKNQRNLDKPEFSEFSIKK